MPPETQTRLFPWGTDPVPAVNDYNEKNGCVFMIDSSYMST